MKLEMSSSSLNLHRDGSSRDADISSSSMMLSELSSSDFDKEFAFVSADGLATVSEPCTESREGKVLVGKIIAPQDSSVEQYFVCKNRAWLQASIMDVDTYGWSSGLEDGVIQEGNVYGRYYTYDRAANKWEIISLDDSAAFILSGCTTNRDGERGIIADTAYYICRDHKWNPVPDEVDDTPEVECSSERIGELLSGKVRKKKNYLCTAEGWVDLLGWSWDVPKQFRFSTYVNVEYGSMTDKRDGQVYRTVVIGNGSDRQVWMAENLNYVDSVSFPNMKSNSRYDNRDVHGELAGRFYSWTAAVDSSFNDCGFEYGCAISDLKRQGVCPEGWHQPSLIEWSTLIKNVGSVDIAGEALKASSGWDSGERKADEFGFSALPVYDSGVSVVFWAATQKDSSAYFISIEAGADEVVVDVAELNNMFSVRCIMD